MVELGLEASVGDSKGSVDFLQKAFNVTLRRMTNSRATNSPKSFALVRSWCLAI